MKVLVVTNTYPSESEPDATPCIKEQMEEMREKFGVKFDLLYINRHNKINYLKAANKIFLLNFKKHKYDVIHAHYGYSGAVARVQLRYPLIVTYHGTDILRAKDGVIGRYLAPIVNSIIVMTKEMKVVSGRDDAHIIPFGVNTNIFYSYSKMAARKELGLPLNKKLVLFPYNPERWEKRFYMAKAVVEKLIKEKIPVRLMAVYNKPRELINKYMNACDVLLMTSDHEGSPMAVREAIICKLPVVSVDVGDVKEIIEKIDGCYIANENIEDLADKVKLSFKHDKLRVGSDQIKSLNILWSAKKVYDVLCQERKDDINNIDEKKSHRLAKKKIK